MKIDFFFKKCYNIYVRLRKNIQGGNLMNRFMKEFTSEKNATVFARSKGAKVIKSYDWDIFTGRMIKTYRVYWTVV